MSTDSVDMDFAAFVRLVLDALEAAGVTYMIGGAVGVWAWGDVRTTRDVDLVIELPFESAMALSRELAEREMLVPIEVIVDLMIEHRGDLPINAIHLHTGYKAELFLLRPGDVYRAMALSRRRLVDLGPRLGEVYVHSPEDLILYKLHYFALSQQPKHIHDVASILMAMAGQLEEVYIETWVEQLGLAATWTEVQRQITLLGGSELP